MTNILNSYFIVISHSPNVYLEHNTSFCHDCPFFSLSILIWPNKLLFAFTLEASSSSSYPAGTIFSESFCYYRRMQKRSQKQLMIIKIYHENVIKIFSSIQ